MPIFFHVLCGVLIGFVVWKSRTQRYRSPLPPGPPKLPFLGHLLVIPQEDHDKVFHDWAKLYGDVVYVTALGKSIVVLNSEQVAIDLLEKKSAIYSDRPPFITCDILGLEGALSFLPYGTEFQASRRLFQQQLSRTQSRSYQDIHIRNGQALLRSLLKNPDDFHSHLIEFASSVITEVTYSQQPAKGADNPYRRLSRMTTESLDNVGTPGFNAVDIFPSLLHLPTWLPGLGLIRRANGTSGESFLTKHLEEYETSGIQDKEHLNRLSTIAQHMQTTGFETTWSTIENFLIVILRYPEVQKKAQAEIHRVIGQDRLPDFGDRKSLPYVEGVMQESMRWHPSIPLGVPHRLMEEDAYQEMSIPKGSIVVSNIRSMTLDERVYHDPHAFLPERFLPKPDGFGEPFPTCVFGYGRRICPGRYLADASVWLFIANLLAIFEIQPTKDKDGKDVIPPLEYNTSLTSHAKEFDCEFKLQSERAKSLIEML